MTFNPAKPDAGPSPALDASIIQTNFSQFASIFSKNVAGILYNHTPLNDLNQGDHESVIFQKQTTDPTITQTLDVLYTKLAPSKIGTDLQLFLKIPKFLPNLLNPTNVPNDPMQITYNQVNTAGPVYQSFLMGGFLLYFGVDTGVTAPNTSIVDTITLSPAPTTILTAIASPNTMTTSGTPIPFIVSTNILSNTQFRINSTSNGSGGAIPYSFSWVAIGTV